MTPLTLPDGTPVFLGCVQPDALRFGGVPAWADANPVLPESEWEEHDDYAPFADRPITQHFNNCTNAALAWLLSTLYRALGSHDVPELSPSYLYALANGGRDAGAMCRDVAAGAMTRGLPPAALWPEEKLFVPPGGMPAAVDAAAARFVALEVYQCLSFADVASALSRRFLVYHGFVLGSAFFDTGRDGRVPPWDGRFANGHAMTSRGLTRRFGDWRTITPNTWGGSFGDHGTGYVDASYFWPDRGNRVNLDAYAFRTVKRSEPLPHSG